MARDFHVGSALRLGLSRSEMLDFQLERALAYQAYDGAAIGEVLLVAAEMRRRGGDREAWVTAWQDAGRRLRKHADAALAAGRPHTARSALLRSYNYLRAAEFFFDRGRHGAVAHRELYEEGLASFDAALPLLPGVAHKVEIPFTDGVALPGHLFLSGTPSPAPTVILSGGGDGFGEESYFFAGVPEALRRGLNVVVFHGPGQRGVLHRHPSLTFTNEPERWLGAVRDFVAARPEVDGDRVALYGVSFGGYLTSRAAAVDGRYAALVANAPIRDMRALMTAGVLDQVPAPLRGLVTRHLDRAVSLVARRDWSLGAAIEQSMLWTSGTRSVEGFLEWCGQFSLEGLEAQIRCPTLALCGEGEGSEAIDQARRFAETVTGPCTFELLTADMGADNHVGIGNITHTAATVFDWLAEQLGADRPDVTDVAARYC